MYLQTFPTTVPVSVMVERKIDVRKSETNAQDEGWDLVKDEEAKRISALNGK